MTSLDGPVANCADHGEFSLHTGCLECIERGYAAGDQRRTPPGIGEFSIGGRVWPGTSKLLEEMGELGQVLGKLIGSHGEVEHYDGSNLRDRMHEEIGDLKAALDFFEDINGLDSNMIDDRAFMKRRLFDQWHAEGK